VPRFVIKAVQIEKTPKRKVYSGIALPGPNHFVKRLAGISKATEGQVKLRQVWYSWLLLPF
jgi:hypothetical protein